jgi:hypothetical protein
MVIFGTTVIKMSLKLAKGGDMKKNIMKIIILIFASTLIAEPSMAKEKQKKVKIKKEHLTWEPSPNKTN